MPDAVDPPTADLLCLHLLSVDGGDTAPVAASTHGILDALDVGEGAITGQFAVVSALSRLEERGLVATRSAPVEGFAEDRTVYELTAAGREHAREVATRLRGREVTVETAEGRETTTLDAAADRLDGTLAAAAARLRDGVLVLDDIEAAVDGEMPFVDRTAALARLDSLYGSADSRADPLVVEGEPGVGKTYLVAEFADRVADREGWVLRGRCPPETDTPYEPFLDALRDLPRDRAERVAGPLTVGTGSGDDPDAGGGPTDEVAPPGLPDGGTLVDPDDLERRRQSLFDSVATELGALTGQGPVVLAFDDVQRLDRPTALLVAYLASELAAEPFAVVGTVSPTTPDPLAALEEGLSAYGLSAESLTLGPFDREATATLVHRLVGTRRVPDAFVDDVHDHAGGNPLFVVESVDRLLESGLVRPDAGVYPESAAAFPVPDTVETTVAARLDALDDGTRELVDLASLVGGSVPVTVLEAASTLAPAAVRDRVDLLVGSRFWERSDAGTVGFVSDVVREAVRESIDEDRGRDLHRHIAEGFETGEATDAASTAAAARHFDRAGEHAAALEASLAAADRATDVYAHELAVEACERAVDLARETGADAALVTALERLGDTYRAVGEFEEATRCYRVVRERATDRARLGRAARKEGAVALDQGEFERAAALAEEALDRARGASDRRGEVQAHVARGQAAKRRGEFETARSAFERALAVADEADDRRGRALSHRSLGQVAEKQGDLETARDRYRHAIEAFREVGDRLAAGNVLGNLGIVAEKQGDYETAREYHQQSLEVSRELGDRHGEAKTLNNLGLIEREEGNYETAREYHRGSLEGYRTLGDRHGEALVLGNLGAIAQAEYDFETARERFRESLERKRAVGDRHGQAKSLGNLGLVATDVGAFDDAREYLREARDIFRDLDDEYGETRSLQFLGSAALAAGEFDRAREHLEAARDRERDLGNRHGEARTLDPLGELARATGDPATARDRHREALDAFRDLGDPVGEAGSRVNLGLAALETGEGDPATHFRSALDLYREVGDPVGQARCRGLLGVVAIADGDARDGRERVERALRSLRPMGVPPVELELRRRHIETERERGALAYARDCCDRARERISAVDAELGRERDRIETLCDELAD